METKKKRNFLLRVDWTNWYSSRADIVQGSKSSLIFFQRFKWPMWIGEVSKKDLFHIYIKLLEWSWWNEFENLDTAGKKRSCVGVFFCLFWGFYRVGWYSFPFCSFTSFYGSLQSMLFTPILSVNATLTNIIVLHTHAHCLMWLNGDTWQENANIQLLKLCSMYRAWNYPSYTILFSSVISIFFMVLLKHLQWK